MKVFADLHLHTKYARATSKEMNITSLSKYAKIKGINLLGTGDFTHPGQLSDLKEKLEPVEDSGLYQYNGTHFMLTTEIALFYFQDNRSRRIHHLINVPSLEMVEQIIDALEKKGGKTGIDGRMMMKISSPELVEILMNISKDIYVVPAHIWTPWFGCLGSKTGFDSVQECFLDKDKHIFAVETGLSSDPPMNWRLSKLDKYTLMSNSDSHSPWPWRLGRECNVFELEKMNYYELWEAVKKKDNKKFLYTIEVDPNYGKYHFSGHRVCKVSFSPKNSLKLNSICPKCSKELNIGVLQRMEELADRPEDFVPKNQIPFKSLLPLYEIISHATGTKTLYSKRVMREQDSLIKEFGTELNVLLEAKKEDLTKHVDEKIAEIIVKARDGKLEYIPGYDGVYGIPVFEKKDFEKHEQKQDIIISPQKKLFDFK